MCFLRTFTLITIHVITTNIITVTVSSIIAVSAGAGRV